MPATASAASLERAVDRMGEDLARRCGRLFANEVERNAPKRTRELVDSIEETAPVTVGGRVMVNVRVGAEHGIYQDEGTGIYGPQGTPITPKRPGGVLRFDWPAAGGIVFARRVRGTEPTRFWTKAVQMWPFLVRRVSAGGG